MPESDDKGPGKLAKVMLWIGALLTAVVTAWLTDAFSLFLRPADLVSAARPPLLVTVLPGTGAEQDLAVASRPTAPRDRAVFLSGRFGDRAFDDVVATLKGAWVGEKEMRVVFESQRDLVRVTDVRVKEVAPRQPIVTGAFVEHPRQGGPANPQLTVSLDARDAFFTQAGKPGRPYFGPHSLSLKRGDQAELGLEIRARKHSHTFVLEVEYVVAGTGKAETVTVKDPAGRPFRVTGAPTAYTAYRTVYRNTGAGLKVVTGRAACRLFLPGRACTSAR
ncbi:hypothetical protein ACBI99_18345 [Nonomuraea sp. ATR24]|uniref:hypothetical protein n=1 Tax=Nonomuraea sp. ATR24 TaxID=1676744 RepID=UPI0035BF0357